MMQQVYFLKKFELEFRAKSTAMFAVANEEQQKVGFHSLPHLQALFMMSPMQDAAVLGTKWQHSWSRFCEFQPLNC